MGEGGDAEERRRRTDAALSHGARNLSREDRWQGRHAHAFGARAISKGEGIAARLLADSVAAAADADRKLAAKMESPAGFFAAPGFEFETSVWTSKGRRTADGSSRTG